MVIQLLVRQYAVCIYVHGTRQFANVPSDYHNPVKGYAVENYSLSQIDNALAKEYITAQEYEETLEFLPKEPIE